MNNESKEDLKPVAYLKPFKRFCMSIGELPSAYVETMTYYEMLIWFIEYMKNTIIPTINNNGEAVNELQDKFVEFANTLSQEQTDFENNITEQQNTFETNITTQQNNYETYITGLFNTLQSYVDNYFNNLDVQEEINNKLDDMVEQGTLQEIVADYLNSKAVFGFDNVSSMKSSTNLINGSYAKTLGYYSKNDGGSALYKIRTKTNEDVIDEMLILSMTDENLIAEIILNDNVNSKQLGLKGDNTDESNKIEKILNIGKNVTFLDGTYLIKKVINVTNCNNIKGENNSILNIIHDNTQTGQDPTTSYGLHFIGNNNFEIKDITIKDSTPEKARFSFNFTFENCHFVNIENVESDGNCGSGILFWKTCSNVIINNCYIHDNYSDGIHVQRGCSNFTITNNKIVRTQDDGIGLNTFDLDTYGKTKQIIVEGNYIADSSVAGSGIAMIGVDDITVKNNTINHTYYGGIRIANNTSGTIGYPNNITIDNNQIINTGYGEHLEDSIYVNYASNLLIINNNIDGNGDRAMALSNLRGNNIIKNNKIKNVERGIIATGSNTDFYAGYNVIVDNNILKNIGGNPIQINGNTSISETSVYITNNIINEMNTNGTATVGISSTNQKNLRILNNNILTTTPLSTPNNYYQKTSGMENAIIHGNYPILNTRESSNFGSCNITTASTPPTTATAGDICINSNATNSNHIAFWYCYTSSNANDNAVWKEVNYTM